MGQWEKKTESIKFFLVPGNPWGTTMEKTLPKMEHQKHSKGEEKPENTDAKEKPEKEKPEKGKPKNTNAKGKPEGKPENTRKQPDAGEKEEHQKNNSVEVSDGQRR